MATSSSSCGPREGAEEVVKMMSQVIHCRYCHADISSRVIIKCAQCSSPSSSFFLCGDCFSSGVNIDDHLNSHDYQVMDCLQKPLFHKEWSVVEELKLLNGIDMFGLGNWKVIGDHIGSKNARACGEHYWEHYMGRFGRCLPPTTCLNGDPENIVNTSRLLPSCASRIAPDLLEKHLNKHQNDFSDKNHDEELEEMLLERQVELLNIPPPEVTAGNCSDVDSVVGRFKGAGKDGSGVGGAKATESKKEQEIRDRIALMPGADLAGFMPIRKDFDIEHDNDAEHLLTDLEFLPDDYPAETMMKLHVVRAYNHRLEERNRRKSFAIERGLVDIKKQQLADRRRCKEDKTILGHLKVFQRFQSEEEFNTLCEGVAVVRRLKKQIEAYKQYRRMGIRTLEQARAFEVDRKKREHQVKATKSKQAVGLGNDPAYQFNSANSELMAAMKSSSSSSSNSQEDVALQYAISLVRDAPNSSLLSDAEINLCAQIGMLPLHYLAVLEALVRESFRNGTLTMEGFRRVVKVQREEQLDAKVTRSRNSSNGNDSNAGNKRKAFYDVHEDGISADAAVKLFDFFVENASFGGTSCGLTTHSKNNDGVVRTSNEVVSSSCESPRASDSYSTSSSSSSRASKRARNTT